MDNEIWPKIDEKYFENENINLVIQINGKKRDVIEIEKDTSEDTIMNIIKNNEKLRNHIMGKEIIKKILVPNKIINLIVK